MRGVTQPQAMRPAYAMRPASVDATRLCDATEVRRRAGEGGRPAGGAQVRDENLLDRVGIGHLPAGRGGARDPASANPVDVNTSPVVWLKFVPLRFVLTEIYYFRIKINQCNINFTTYCLSMQMRLMAEILSLPKQ